MPLYEYRCAECQHLEEVLQKVSDPAPALCPACGAKGTLAKEVSLTSFQLKGGGWYKDLYSSTPKDGGDKSGSSGSPSSEAKADKGGSDTSTKADSKKAEPKKTDAKPKASGGSKAAA